MSNVIPISGGTSPAQETMDKFWDLRDSASHRDGVRRAIGNVCGSQSNDEFLEFVQDPRQFKYGIVYPLTIKGNEDNPNAIAIRTEFPVWLARHSGLTEEKAIDVAVFYINSFSLTQSALQNRPWAASSRVPRVGKPEFWLPNDRGPISLAYRLSACLAIEASKQIALPTMIEADHLPLPPHLASLADPLSRTQAREMHTLFR